MAVYKLQLKNKQFSILSTAWDKGKSIYKRLKGWLSKKPALIPKGPASDVVYNSAASAAKNGAKAGGYADLAGQGGQAAANKSGGYLRGTRAGAEVDAIRNRKQAARGGNGANNAKNNTKNGGANNGNVKNNQNQPKQNNNSKKPAVYKVGNGKGITFNKVRSNNAPNMNGFTTTLSGNPYDLGGYSGFKYVYK